MAHRWSEVQRPKDSIARGTATRCRAHAKRNNQLWKLLAECFQLYHYRLLCVLACKSH